MHREGLHHVGKESEAGIVRAEVLEGHRGGVE